jgi:type I restriction enzyme S subunit
MSLPRYPAYKPSGVEWLGEVPEHWGVLPLKREFDVVGGSTPKSDMQEYWDGDIQWITPADLSRLQSFEITESIRTITAEGLNSCGTTMVPSGSVVVSTRAPIGSLGIAGIDLCTNQGCKALIPIDQISSRFTAYFLSIASEALNVRGRGATFLEISGDELGAFKATLPPCQEQVQIATFLDRETAKIDALIAEQQRLIELLQEKRQAVISHAVTKGLNPDAPMKDSGVEWLGDVPEHWEVTRYKRFCELQRGHDLTNDEREEGPYPVVTSSGINGFHSAFIGKAPGVVTGRYGSTGTAFFIEQDYWPHNTSLYIKDFHGNSARFSWYLLQAIDLKSLSAKSAVPGIDRNDVHELFVAFPQLKEQIEIATHLDAYCQKQSLLIREADISVQLLQERRSALISAAVTGQIDVRGLVPEASAA